LKLQSRQLCGFEGHFSGSIRRFLYADFSDDFKRKLESEASEQRCGTEAVDLASVTACYLRPDGSRRLDNIANSGENSAAWRHALSIEAALVCWADITLAFVVNRPSAMSTNSSKPYQLELIRALGMAVPETLVTTDPAAVLSFLDEHGEIIYKSVSGVRSKVSKLRPEHLERIGHGSSCPTQFQQHISGVDYRVHVVGDAVFTARLVSMADDYRYADGPDEVVEVTPCEIPSKIAESCQKIAIGIGLPVAGLDLRRTPEDRWYCFEVNPSPGFTFYDRHPKQPIATTIARLLASSSA
jgi:RimK-like ATP-grasp domain